MRLSLVFALLVVLISSFLILHDPHIPPSIKVLDFFLGKLFLPLCGVMGTPENFKRTCSPVEDIIEESNGEKNGVIIKNIQIPFALNHSNHTIPAHFYSPFEMCNQKLPLLIFVHGGGFAVGQPSIHKAWLTELVQTHNIYILAVNYRKSPEHPFPAAIHDVGSVWDWINKMEAKELQNIDPNLIAIGGDSAGGNLALSGSFMARDKRIPLYFPDEGFQAFNWKLNISLQALIYPTMQHSAKNGSKTNSSNFWILNSGMMSFFSSAYQANIRSNETKHNFHENYYLFPLKAKSMKGLPKTVLITATYDPLYDEDILFRERLRKDGVEVVFRNYESVHGFFSFSWLQDAKDGQQFLADELRNAGFKSSC